MTAHSSPGLGCLLNLPMRPVGSRTGVQAARRLTDALGKGRLAGRVCKSFQRDDNCATCWSTSVKQERSMQGSGSGGTSQQQAEKLTDGTRGGQKKARNRRGEDKKREKASYNVSDIVEKASEQARGGKLDVSILEGMGDLEDRLRRGEEADVGRVHRRTSLAQWVVAGCEPHEQAASQTVFLLCGAKSSAGEGAGSPGNGSGSPACGPLVMKSFGRRLSSWSSTEEFLKWLMSEGLPCLNKRKPNCGQHVQERTCAQREVDSPGCSHSSKRKACRNRTCSTSFPDERGQS